MEEGAERMRGEAARLGSRLPAPLIDLARVERARGERAARVPVQPRRVER